MIRFLFAVASVFIVVSNLALADCNVNNGVSTEVTDRKIHSSWGAGTVDLLEGDVSLILALRAKLCGNLTHVDFVSNHPPQSEGATANAENPFLGWPHHREMRVYGWSDTTDDKLVFSVKVPTGGGGEYKVNLLLSANTTGNVFQISVPATSTSGTLTAEVKGFVEKNLGVRETRVPMTGTIRLNEGVNEIEVKLTVINPTQVTKARDAGSKRLEQEKDLGVMAMELIKESEYDALLKRGRTFPDMSWYTEKGTWGLFVHYSPWGTYPHKNGSHSSGVGGGSYTAATTQLSTRWAKFVGDFEVVPFVDKVEKMGASYVVWTIFHGTVYFPGPSAVLDSILPGRTTTRDLIKDVGNELEKRGMRLLFYYHPGKDDDAWNRASGFYNRTAPLTFGNNVVRLHAEWASKYNGTNGYPKLGSTGIYIDAFWQGPIQRGFPFKKFADAIKAPGRLPNAIIGISNQHIIPPTLFNDIMVDDNGRKLKFPDPTIYDNQPGVPPGKAPSPTTEGNAASAVVKLQWDWYYWKASERDSKSQSNDNGGRGWENKRRKNLWKDEQLVAFISYANGMGAPVFLNSILSADVRAGVEFMNPTSIAQMRNVTRIIKNNLRPHIADNSELNRITYTGAWAHYPKGVDINAQGKITNAPNSQARSYNFTRSDTTAQGASVEFTFVGSEIRVFANQNSSGGPIEVHIDGNRKSDATTLSSTVKHQVKIFEDTSLSAGRHTIKLTNKQAKQFNFDYFETAIPSGAACRDFIAVDDADSAITYSTGWTNAANRPFDLGNTISHTQQNGATAEYTFNGPEILFYTQKGPNSRKMNIYIDDTLVETDDGYAASNEFGALAYRNSMLSSGQHKIKVECLAASKNNPGVTGSSWCHVDQFSVSPITNNP